MAVHARAVGVEQQRAGSAVADGAVDRAGDGRRHRHEDDLVALADDAQHPVAVFLAEIGDIEAGCLEDPQTQQAEQTDQGEVEQVGRQSWPR